MAIFGLDFTSVERYLESYGAYIVRQAESRLNRRKVSGALRNSLRYKLIKNKDGYVLMFLSNRYGEFINKGVSGTQVVRSFIDKDGKRRTSPHKYTTKQPPIFAIERFIKQAGIKGRSKGTRYVKKDGTVKYYGRGRFISNRSLAFIFAKSIKRKGIRAASFYTQPLSYSYKVFKKEMLKNFRQDVLKEIKLFTK